MGEIEPQSEVEKEKNGFGKAPQRLRASHWQSGSRAGQGGQGRSLYRSQHFWKHRHRFSFRLLYIVASEEREIKGLEGNH